MPRTTINDWLSRYPQFIDSAQQGKRKIYTDASLAVLKEISQMRDSGLSSFQIEEELAKKHPIHGLEVQDEKKTTEESPEKQSPPDENSQLIIRNSMTEIGGMIRNALLEMNSRIDELEKTQSNTAKHATLWFSLSLLIFIAFIAAGVLAAIKIDEIMKDKKTLELRNQDISLSLDGSKLLISEKEKQIGELDVNIQKSRKELEEQRIKFDAELEKMRNEEKTAREAEILRLRDDFAGKALELLKKIEGAQKNKDEMNLLVLQLQAQSYEQNSIIRTLSEKLTIVEKESVLTPQVNTPDPSLPTPGVGKENPPAPAVLSSTQDSQDKTPLKDGN